MCLHSVPSSAQQSDPLLFEADSVLELTMPIRFNDLCRPSVNPDCDFWPTVFEYRDSNGVLKSIPISVRRRDGWRALQTNCQVPTLFVRFSGEGTRGTPFEGQTSLALTSHCGKGYLPANVPSRRLPDDFESYVITEYLGYRLYNLLTDYSLRARAVRINYADPANPRRDFTHYAFFTEHFESLASRHEAELVSGEFDLASLEMDTANQMALFNFMVGNTDWSIEDQQNVLLLRKADGSIVPVLYDLDMSGLVSAHYARPAPELPIKTVRQRYYMGYCHDGTDWDALFEKFWDLHPGFMQTIANMPFLNRGERRRAGVYLETFYELLRSDRKRTESIVEACQAFPVVD